MARPVLILLCLFVASAALADARQLRFNGGNSAGRPVNQGMSYSVEGDRNAAGQGAASEAILRAARGELKASLATSIANKAAYMTTRRSAGLKTFDALSAGGRRLQDSGTTSNSDRVQLALSSAQDTINMAVNSGANLKSAKTATASSMAFARLATRLSARASDFSSP